MNTTVPTIAECRDELQETLVWLLGNVYHDSLVDVRAYPPQTIQPASAWIELTGIEAGDNQDLPYGQARATWRVTVTARPGMAIADATSMLDRVTQTLLGLDVGGITVGEYTAISSDSLAAPLPATRVTLRTIITRRKGK